MKLLKKTNRIYLLFSSVLMLGAGFALFFILNAIVDEEMNEQLYLDANRVHHEIEANRPYPQLPPVISVKQFDSEMLEGFAITDTLIFDPLEEEEEPFRELTLTRNHRGKGYAVTMRTSLIEGEDFWFAIGWAIGGMFVLLLISIVWVNKRISKNIWAPFYANLEQLKAFSIQGDVMQLEATDITEFNDLNTTIKGLADQVQSDYHALKEFTANAAHEMQTPLAIIIGKLELISQKENVMRDHASLVSGAYDAARRLSKLNKALLLLAKIENRQFGENEEIALDDLLHKHLSDVDDLMADKGLVVYPKIIDAVAVHSNVAMVELLINNLIGNAIKHSLKNSKIGIALRDNSLTITNSGEAPEEDPSVYFERFRKASQTSASLGLGLSIIRKICEVEGWQIKYVYENDQHQVEIRFKH